MLNHIGEQLSETPEQADVVHDLLAFLAEQMVMSNMRKRTEIGGFLAWLERKVGAHVATLSNKDKLREYDQYDLDTLLQVLSQNRRQLGVDPSGRNVQESIVREYAKSMETLNPLNGKIAATDHLINLIVYRLYGLTESEVAIVRRGDAVGQGTR